MSPAGKRGVVIGGVLVMVAIVVAGVLVLRGGSGSPIPAADEATVSAAPLAPTPAAAAQQYLQDLASNDTDNAGHLTDNPAAASAVLSDAWSSLTPAEVQTKLVSVNESGNTASASFAISWTLPADHVWAYHGTFDIVRTNGDWRVHWTPAALHPSLQSGQRLKLVTAMPDHPTVVDRNGTPLVLTGPGGTRLANPKNFPILQSTLVQEIPPNTSDVFAVERVDATGRDLQTLFGHTGAGVQPTRSTLSTGVQSAAQSAVDTFGGPALIVALQPSDGGVLAVARNAQSSSLPFTGLYAPGSTFKIVTATGALDAGAVNDDSELPCPGTAVIGTRTISNERQFDLGTVPMRQAFAASCNTTFGRLASELPANGLVEAADRYGLNADFDIPGLATQTGKVVPPSDSDQQVEDGIGQGNVEVSPFGEALMAATVDAGHAVTPRLWENLGTTVDSGYSAPAPAVLAQLRTMMREVVTGGTATGLAGSGLVYGKTGTAQFGSGDEAHGWFVGYRGDLAFAVFLEGANSSTPAVTVAAKFLAALH